MGDGDYAGPNAVAFRCGIEAGRLPTRTVGEPGAHGAGVFGTHGIGVSTPIAADVADATAGLARLIQTPKGAKFTMGL